MCNCLVENGVRRIFFINGHGPNIPIVEEISQDLASKGVHLAQIDLWRFIGSVSSDLGESKLPLGHSGELATSVMMAVKEDLVRRGRMRVEYPRETLSNTYPAVIQYYPSSMATPSAFAGDPTRATKEKGEKTLARCVDHLEEFLRRWMEY
jgi:creatinine amidohydrolase